MALNSAAGIVIAACALLGGSSSLAANCPGDIDESSQVDVTDLLAIIAGWGPCPPGEPCTADLDGNGYGDICDPTCLLWPSIDGDGDGVACLEDCNDADPNLQEDCP